MKKTTLLAGLALFLLTACYKADYDAFGGHTDTSENPVKEYMLTLADDIVAASLEELESALQMDPQDKVTQALYYIQGDLSSGGTWIIKRECPLKGLALRNLIKSEGLMGWLIEFDGELALSGETFPTRFTVQAERVPSEAVHTDWRITKFSGSRTEREGYRCTFDITSGLVYEALQENDLWNARGTIQMNVYKDDTLVDTGILTLKGPRSGAVFVHGVGL